MKQRLGRSSLFANLCTVYQFRLNSVKGGEVAARRDPCSTPNSLSEHGFAESRVVYHRVHRHVYFELFQVRELEHMKQEKRILFFSTLK